MPKVLDPFVMAQRFTIKDDSHLHRSMVSIFTRLGFDITKDIPLIATPANRETGVANAKPTGACAVCGNAVWLSPSSKQRMRETKEDIVIVCLQCLENEHGKLTGAEFFDSVIKS